MLTLLLELTAFALRLLMILAGVAFLLAFAARLIQSARSTGGQRLRVRRINDDLDHLTDQIRVAVLPDAQRKSFLKERRRTLRARIENPDTPRVFVLDFNGDTHANPVGALRDEITLLLGVLRPIDEVVLRLESTGGLVHAYGLAAAQVLRLREAGHTVTACVDRTAASGGYMMACVADRILAAPFAIIGSIGVLARVPNLHRALDKLGVDYEEMTAGQYKSTVTLLGEITPEGRRHFKEQLEDTHDLFKSFVQRFRPDLDLDTVATGEFWYGDRALALGLVDGLQTSDAYLFDRAAEALVVEVSLEDDVPLPEKVTQLLTESADALLLRWFRRAERPRIP